MIFHSIVFSLAEPQKNEYVYMLALLVKSLLRTGTYKPDQDIYYVMADAATIPLLREIPILQPIRFLEIPKPADVYEGMTYKYRLFDFCETTDDTVMYLDVDLLSLKSARIAIAPDKLWVFPEGSKWDTNYRGSESHMLDFARGFTAGFFLYRWGPRVEAIFDEILRKMDRSAERFYTLDQPHFNMSLSIRQEAIGQFPDTFISFNGHTNLRQAHFLNLAGDPGNGPFHFRKALGMFLAIF